MFDWIKSLFTRSAPVKVEPLPKVNPRPPLEVVPPKEPGKVISLPVNTTEQVPGLNPNFDAALEYTYGNEGDLSNDKFDRGGITKYGIILDDLKRIGQKNATSKDIESLTRDQAKLIYKKLYWDSQMLDLIENRGVAIAMFDIGVVRGVGVPPKYAKQICGSSAPSDINEHNPADFIRKFSKASSDGFRAIWLINWTQIRFKNGWENRAQRLLTLLKYT